jgi:hypothetical protein
MALSRSTKTTAFQYWNVNIFYIKFEHRICLNNNLKKCHTLGHLSLSLNGANQINMSKLPNNATKFVDQLSIISVGNDFRSFFLF